MVADTTKLAYTAGLLDGEGTIYLRIVDGGTLVLRLTIVNTNELLMQWLQLNFGGNVTRSRSDKNPKHKDLWAWGFSGNAAVDFLKSILPYLVIKKAQAQLGVEAWDNRQPTPRGERLKPVSAEVLAERAGFVELMHGLNRKGPVPACQS